MLKIFGCGESHMKDHRHQKNIQLQQKTYIQMDVQF